MGQPITFQRIDSVLKAERRAKRRIFAVLCVALFLVGFLTVTCYELWEHYNSEVPNVSVAE